MNAEIESRVEQPKRWPTSWVIAALITAVVLMQWSSLQELYYNVAGIEAPESSIKWQHDLDTALAAARTQQRPVLLVFGATWCPPCKKMKRDVWPDPQVAELVESKFVPLYVDVDDRSQAELSTRYSVSSIPAVFVLDAEGIAVNKGSSMSASATLAFLKSAL